MYDTRVEEAVRGILDRFPEAEVDETLWPAIKLAYIPLLHEHRQPECAETFYNSVACAGAAPALLPQRVHLLAPGGRHRAPGRRGTRLPLLLPAQGRPAQDAQGHPAPTSGSPIPGKTCAATCSSLVHALRAALPAAGARAPEPADPGARARSSSATRAAYVVGKLINGNREAAVRGADPAERARRAVPGRPAVGRRTS